MNFLAVWVTCMSDFPNIEWHDQPDFERPVFISYCFRDFRIAYAILKLILTPEEWEDPFFKHQVLFDSPLPWQLSPDLRGKIERMSALTGDKDGISNTRFPDNEHIPAFMAAMRLSTGDKEGFFNIISNTRFAVNGGQDPRKVGGAKFFGMTFADGLAAPCRRPLGGNQRPGGKRCQRRKPPEAGAEGPR